MTAPKDTQEMLAEHGAIKLADDVHLTHYIDDTTDRLKLYKHLLTLINNKGLELALKSDMKDSCVWLIKKYLENGNVPVTDKTMVAFLNAYIERASEGVEEAKKERR